MREEYRGFTIIMGVIYDQGHKVHHVENNEDAKEWIDWALNHKDQQAVLLTLAV